jgi:CheY-like chemotaxis protein
MFFVSKIRSTAEALGVAVRFPRGAEAMFSAAEETPPDLIVVDLHNDRVDAAEVAAQLKQNEKFKTVPLLAFFSHLEVELQRKAREAGYDQVIPRSAFARDLAQILQG